MIVNIKSIQISSIIFILNLVACVSPPDFSDIPEISFQNLRYVQYENARDSLKLTFNFQDGDGDIGLGPNEVAFPFHSYNYVIDADGEVVKYSNSIKPPLYTVLDTINHSEKKFLNSEDIRTVYNCSDYLLVKVSDTKSDTLFVNINEYSKGLHLDFYRKRNGEYNIIDFASEFGNADCSVVDFSARIPFFDIENIGKAIYGEITYSMFSRGFPVILRQDTFRLEFYIYDHSLNKSNVVITPDFTLRNITEKG